MNNLEKLNSIFDEILSFAERNQKCLRKAVGCAAITFDADLNPMLITMAHNGPSRADFKCLNIVGSCGCSHAEPRLVQNLLKMKNKIEDMPLFMVCTYSPCTNCANITIDSSLFDGVFYDILTEHDVRGELFIRQELGTIQRKEIVNSMKIEKPEQINDKIKEWITRSGYRRATKSSQQG